MIYIYSKNITNRLVYTFEVIFKHILKTDFQLVDKSYFLSLSDVPKVNYSEEPIADTIWIKPHSLLFESEIFNQNIEVTYFQECPYFFRTSKDAELPYDLFASTFYLLSRYEEYLDFKPDVHGRFSSQESLAFKTNFLHLPVVHLWTEKLKVEILKNIPSYQFPIPRFKKLNTIDIDIAYAYKGKPFFRQVGGIVKSIVQFDYKEIGSRIKYYFTGKDPYDTYSYIEQIAEISKLDTYFFLQMGNYGLFDKNIPINKTLIKLIKRLSFIGKIGIHLSYESNNNKLEIPVEIEKLEKVLSQKITENRQHFLKLKFPETYENLIENGIKTDFTLGFADEIGFRAGICVPFPFFNLVSNSKRPLTLIPFQIMDGTLHDYKKYTKEEAIEKSKAIIKSVENVNGLFVSIFHNSSLLDKDEWEGWRVVYEAIIKV